jgi:hypothetical protein
MRRAIKKQPDPADLAAFLSSVEKNIRPTKFYRKFDVNKSNITCYNN